jgi:hypothetical protein
LHLSIESFVRINGRRGSFAAFAGLTRNGRVVAAGINNPKKKADLCANRAAGAIGEANAILPAIFRTPILLELVTQTTSSRADHRPGCRN